MATQQLLAFQLDSKTFGAMAPTLINCKKQDLRALLTELKSLLFKLALVDILPALKDEDSSVA